MKVTSMSLDRPQSPRGDGENLGSSAMYALLAKHGSLAWSRFRESRINLSWIVCGDRDGSETYCRLGGP